VREVKKSENRYEAVSVVWGTRDLLDELICWRVFWGLKVNEEGFTQAPSTLLFISLAFVFDWM